MLGTVKHQEIFYWGISTALAAGPGRGAAAELCGRLQALPCPREQGRSCKAGAQLGSQKDPAYFAFRYDFTWL